ncbi:unnamed protein product [Protopolystoma xenopodis]|uniref:Uncharacterized protein n=1 Tax=Protopolystoma xenopodis TaxID=117903 RepID=A0A3S5C2E0_9PLAT|nr:unnamed protein product [Protopolystoma xenopodis]
MTCIIVYFNDLQGLSRHSFSRKRRLSGSDSGEASETETAIEPKESKRAAKQARQQGDEPIGCGDSDHSNGNYHAESSKSALIIASSGGTKPLEQSSFACNETGDLLQTASPRGCKLAHNIHSGGISSDAYVNGEHV